MCEHGDRRVTRMEKNGTKTPLATHYNVSTLHMVHCELIALVETLMVTIFQIHR